MQVESVANPEIEKASSTRPFSVLPETSVRDQVTARDSHVNVTAQLNVILGFWN